MSQDIYVNIARSGTSIAKNVQVQVDLMNPKMGADYDSNHPFDIFEGYIYYLPPGLPIRRSDLLTDLVNIDPLTNQPVAYRVVGRPEAFPDGHVQVVLNQYLGSNS